jgi:ribosomal protein S27AE
MRERLKVALSARRFARKSACPNCGAVLDAYTVARLHATSIPDDICIAGEKTICARCGALLVFADDNGTLRTMTLRERATWHPDEDQLRVYRILRQISGDFTKRKFR